MRLLVVAAAIAAAWPEASLRAQDTLRVLRHTPADSASSASTVTVMFDRPVAAGLDSTVRAASLFRIEPHVTGSVSWRDPVTIRFVPSEPLTPGTRYTVTIDTAVRAVDGSRLPSPRRFEFRVRGPSLLARSFDRYGGEVDTLAPDGHIRLTYSAPVDLDRLGRRVRIELSRCADTASVPLRVLGQQLAGATGRQADRFRTIVDLEPAKTLPLGCDGLVVIPTTDDDAPYGREERYRVKTAVVFRAVDVGCGLPYMVCGQDLLWLRFSSPVRRDDLVRFVRMNGEPPVINGDATVSKLWTVKVLLVPRATYTFRVDAALADRYGRRIDSASTLPIVVDDHVPQLTYPAGIVTVPRGGSLTLPLKSVNLRSVRVISYRVPDSLRIAAMSGVSTASDLSPTLRRSATETTTVALPDELNADTTIDLPLPRFAVEPDHPLFLVRVVAGDRLPDLRVPPTPRDLRHWHIALSWPAPGYYWTPPFAAVQVTDLAMTARLLGPMNGSALVTGAADGRPRANVTVTQFDRWQRIIGRGVTNDRGIATIARVAADTIPPPRTPVSPMPAPPTFTSIQAETPDDHVIVSLGGRMIGYQAASPLDITKLGARYQDSPFGAGAIFADRGIYRPGETVHLKGIVRRGMLGALELPGSKDSARIVIRRDDGSWMQETTFVVRDTVKRVSAFGTIVDSLGLRPGLRLGRYVADLQLVVADRWRSLQTTSFKLEEYRAPSFEVEVDDDTTIHYLDDTIVVHARGRLLFGASMRGAQVRWKAELFEGAQPSPRGEARGWSSGIRTWWHAWGPVRAIDGTVSLDSAGRAPIHIPVSALTKTSSGSANISVSVVDADEQVVGSAVSARVSSSRLYIQARIQHADSAWLLGRPARIDVRTVDEDGKRIAAPAIRAVITWRHVRRGDRETNAPDVLRVDTIRDRQLALDDGQAVLAFTPDSAGDYEINLSGRDSRSATAVTSLAHSAVATISRVVPPPPARPTEYRLVLTTDTIFRRVGEVARVRFDSPFRDAEAWITLEREGVIDQQRRRVARGPNVIDVPITDRLVPNVFVSVVLAARDEQGRPDSSSQRIRAGYLELRVKSDTRSLSIQLAADRASYSPRDTAAIRIRVRDQHGVGVRSEVALWAVDKGVADLTGYSTPDVRSQIYTVRGVGLDLWSTIPTMVTTDAAFVATFMRQAMLMLNEVVMTASVGASMATLSAPTLRSHFASTAFYLGQVDTDAHGTAVARAAVPDNLTTFRVMAVAVSAGDQYGRADTTLLVTRPLVARAALPRFLRPTDSLIAGVVITARDGRPRGATAEAAVQGVALRSPARVNVALTSTSSSEARFIIQTPARNAVPDSVTVQLGASDGRTADATETRLPIRPDFHVRTHAVLGAVRDSQTVEITLPPEIDPARSRLRLRIGTSRLSSMLAAYRWLRSYRFDCSEQLSSVGRGIVAVWRATRAERSDALGGDPHAKLQELVDELSRRQRADGAIKYWPTFSWSTPWLTSYAGLFMLEARDEGTIVDPSVIGGIARYLENASRAPVETGGRNRFEQRDRRLELAERIAAVDFLRRFGAPDTTTERALLDAAGFMTWEDRLRLAEVLSTRANLRDAAERLVDDAWTTVTPAGHRVDLPDSSHGPRAFPSRIAPAARLLSASLILRPTQPLLGALVETVLQQGSAEGRFAWSTQDYASVVMALAHFDEGAVGDRVVEARAGTSRFVATPPRNGVDTTIVAPLAGMLEKAPNGDRILSVHVDASAGDRPVYFALEVDEVPTAAPVKPDIHGIVVERWYERLEDGSPVTRVSEGDLVRVRLRVTVPADREFVALEDPLPAGLEPVNVGLLTNGLAAFSPAPNDDPGGDADRDDANPFWQSWLYGGWDAHGWSPWEYKELHDDRVSYFTRMLWTGSYTTSYVARATTAGSFVAPPAYAEEMYNPALQGRSAGGRILIASRP